MSPEYILLTGTSGFIGSHLVNKIALDGSYIAVAIVRKVQNTYKMSELKKRGVLFVMGDYYDTQLIRDVFKRYPIRFVIHIAGLSGVGNGKKEDYLCLNVKGTEILLEAALNYRVKRFVFCSSVGVFGTIPYEVPAKPETQLRGDNDYHFSKILAEERVKEYMRRGLDAYIIRPTITYGSGVQDSGFPSTLVKLVKKRLLVLSTKDIKIHLLDVSGLTDLFLKVISANMQSRNIFIAADKKPISFRELVDTIHYTYYHIKYPRFLRLTGFVFLFFIKFFQLVRNEKWTTRLLLISTSWYYDIGDTMKRLQYRPSETMNTFIRSMCK
jgi:nucleoside-diphosphate-sugar epimerase